MRMTKKKRKILDMLGADGDELRQIENFVARKKPFDVSSISYWLHGDTNKERQRIEEISTLRTLKKMVRDGQIESFKTVEDVYSSVFRSDTCRRQLWKFCLPGENGFKMGIAPKDFIDGECEVLSVEASKKHIADNIKDLGENNDAAN